MSRRRGPRSLSPQSIFDREAVLQALVAHNIKESHASAVWRSVIRAQEAENPAALSEVLQIKGLPKKAQELLLNDFTILTSTVVDIQETSAKASKSTFDGKLVVQLQDGKLVETVVIGHLKHGTVNEETTPTDEEKREPELVAGHVTVCVSSQVGCKMACTFCETGTMGFNGNLTSGEIVEQLVHAHRIVKRRNPNLFIRNVVFMGMGEPLDNYEAVLWSIRMMSDKACFGLGYKNITVSTVGVMSRIPQLARDCKDVNLALSLHAPNQQVRLDIVPSARGFPFEKLLQAMDEYIEISGKGVMIEYIVIKGVNASAEIAHQLGQALSGKNCWINLIPYNPTAAGERFSFATPSDQELKSFKQILNQYQNHVGKELTARIRWSTTTGREVSGACGQLALKKISPPSQVGADSRDGTTDIEDMFKDKQVRERVRPVQRKAKADAESLSLRSVRLRIIGGAVAFCVLAMASNVQRRR